jgi:hypothetical protein
MTSHPQKERVHFNKPGASQSSANRADFPQVQAPWTGILNFSEGAQHLYDSTISNRPSYPAYRMQPSAWRVCSSSFALITAPVVYI